MNSLRALLLACAVAGCSSEHNAAPNDSTSAARPSLTAPIKVLPQQVRLPDEDPNPLALPPRALEVVPGQKVYVPPAEMMRGAKVGSALSLRVAGVVSREGDNVVIAAKEGPAYKVQVDYLIPIPEVFKPKMNGPVIAEWAGQLRHGVLRRMARDSYTVRFTDTEDKSDRTLKGATLIAQAEGLHAGNYAVWRDAETMKQVLLVSDFGDSPHSWLVLAYAGASAVVPESALSPVPIVFEPKEGADVMAVWLGSFREGTVKSVDHPGLATVKFDRAGRAVQLGWGSLMPDLPPSAAPSSMPPKKKP